MVSSRNIIIGLGVLLVGVIALRGVGGGSGLITKDEIITPTILPAEPEPVIENPQIQILKDAIAGVQGFIKQTFKAPPTFKKVRGIVFKDGVPQSRAATFQPLPRGSRFTIDPFTAKRIALPVGARGSAVTERFFGGAQQLLFNKGKVEKGNILKSEATQIVTDLQNQLKILQANSV